MRVARSGVERNDMIWFCTSRLTVIKLGPEFSEEAMVEAVS